MEAIKLWQITNQEQIKGIDRFNLLSYQNLILLNPVKLKPKIESQQLSKNYLRVISFKLDKN